MEPLFLAGHPALDFLNTRPEPHGEAVEFIGDGRAFARWMETGGLLGQETAVKIERRLGVGALNEAAGEARKLREWARDWITRWHDAPKGSYDSELRRLNRVLEGAKGYAELVRSPGGFELAQRSRLESAEDLLVPIAAQLAVLVAGEAPELVKRCEGEGCTLWFVDRTKAHGRRFCSAAVCGNRAKVAAFRERQRAER
jgi:predicted RNA-binding Zn ribbon-like protein